MDRWTQMNRQRHIKALGLVDSDKKMCFMFSLKLANANIVTPEQTHFWPQCHNWNRLGRRLLGNAS